MLRRLLSMFTGSGTRRRRTGTRTGSRGGMMSRLMSAARAFFGGGRRTRTRSRI